jgi:hypothetical protein
LNQAQVFDLGADPTTVERLRAVPLDNHDEEPTLVGPEPRRRRSISAAIRLQAADNLPIAQFVCAVVTSLAALLYAVSFLTK